MFYECLIHNLSVLHCKGAQVLRNSHQEWTMGLIWLCYWPYTNLITSPRRRFVPAKSRIVRKTREASWSSNCTVKRSNTEEQRKVSSIKCLADLGVSDIKGLISMNTFGIKCGVRTKYSTVIHKTTKDRISISHYHTIYICRTFYTIKCTTYADTVVTKQYTVIQGQLDKVK